MLSVTFQVNKNWLPLPSQKIKSKLILTAGGIDLRAEGETRPSNRIFASLSVFFPPVRFQLLYLLYFLWHRQHIQTIYCILFFFWAVRPITSSPLCLLMNSCLNWTTSDGLAEGSTTSIQHPKFQKNVLFRGAILTSPSPLNGSICKWITRWLPQVNDNDL